MFSCRFDHFKSYFSLRLLLPPNSGGWYVMFRHENDTSRCRSLSTGREAVKLNHLGRADTIIVTYSAESKQSRAAWKWRSLLHAQNLSPSRSSDHANCLSQIFSSSFDRNDSFCHVRPHTGLCSCCEY